jgi:hypothetical protein
MQRKKFQLLLTATVLAIISLGFGAFIYLAQSYIYQDIVEQATRDNRVIGQAIIELLRRTHRKLNLEQDSLQRELQPLCDAIINYPIRVLYA